MVTVPGESPAARKKNKERKDFMLTEAYTNTFCIVSIFARVELLNYLQVSGVYGLSGLTANVFEKLFIQLSNS